MADLGGHHRLGPCSGADGGPGPAHGVDLAAVMAMTWPYEAYERVRPEVRRLMEEAVAIREAIFPAG